MSNLSIQLPDSLYKNLQKIAEQDGVSLDQFVALAITEKISALTTEDYLQERASRGQQVRYQDVLAKVPDVEPKAYDRLPSAGWHIMGLRSSNNFALLISLSVLMNQKLGQSLAQVILSLLVEERQLLEDAIKHASLSNEIEDLRERLIQFETTYQMSSEKFYQRFQNGELGDSMDFFEWNTYYEMHNAVES